jgi:hypothetical protein
MDLSPENDFMNILQSNYIYVLSANAVRPSKDVDFRIVAVPFTSAVIEVIIKLVVKTSHYLLCTVVVSSVRCM